MNKKSRYLLAILPFLVIVLLFEIAPLCSTVFYGFLSPETGQFTLDNFKQIFSTLSYRAAILNSINISLISSAAGILISFLAAKAIHNASGRLKDFFMAVLNMTSNFSGVPLAFAFMILLGNTGVLIMIGKQLNIPLLSDFNLYTKTGVTLTYIYFQIPFSALLLIPAFEHIREEWKEANMLFGGSSFGFWRKVGLPVLMPSVLSTFSVMFCNALSAYATAYAIMMNNYSLLPISISGMYTGELQTRYELGGALSLILMGLMCAAVLINTTITRKIGRERV